MSPSALAAAVLLADSVFGNKIASSKLTTLCNELQQLGAVNINAFLAEVTKACKTGDYEEDSADIFAQGQFALGLARKGWVVTFNPGGSTADLLFNDGAKDIYADVKRLRTQDTIDKSLLAAMNMGEAIEYGDELKGTSQVITAIGTKAKQATTGAPFVVFILSASNYAEPQEFSEAIRLIEVAASNSGPNYSAVSSVVFTASTGPFSTQPIKTWVNVNADCPLTSDTNQMLESLNISLP